MRTTKFGLSASGKIAAALTLAFVLAESALAAGITAAGGAGAQPQVSTAGNGAQVVNIVAPSAAGVSHNQYQDFNVNQPGAVFNNALQAGQSVLAGQLGANGQLNGVAASVILNEVVSRNPSLLLGKQEVFGKAADYVLANPNGIACNGCGFINIPRASLVVGNANLQNGAIASLQAANNGNALSVAGSGASGVQVLDLIAPKLDIRGAVTADNAIRVRAGFNTVDYASGQITATAAAPQGVGNLDSYFLGAMQAGRINIVSTAAGAGVNVGGNLAGGDELTVNSAGALAVQAAKLNGKQLALSGASVDISGRVDSETGKDSKHDESWFIWKTGESNSSSSKTDASVKRASLQGDAVSVTASGNAHVGAADIQGQDVTVKAASVNLDGQLAESKTSSSDHAWKNSWAFNQDKNAATQEQSVARIKAGHDAAIASTGGDIAIAGASVQAGNQIKLDAVGQVKLSALTETDSSSDVGNRKNDGAALETGSWNNSSSQQRLVQAQLRADGALGITASGDIDAKAAILKSGGDTILSAQGKTTLAAQSSANSSSTQNGKTYWGGIGGGGNQNNSSNATVNTGSAVNAGGKLFINGDQGVAINGSQAKGAQGAYGMAKSGGIVIDSALDLSQTRTDQRTGTAFNITSSSSKGSTSQQTAVGSALKSDADLQLISAGDVAITGSLVKAAQALNIQAVGDIKATSQAAETHNQSQDTQLAWRGVGAETGDKQYRGGVRLEHTSATQQLDQTGQTGSQLSGGSVKLAAGNDLTLSGSKLESAGDASLNGRSVSLNSVQNSSHNDSSTTVSGGGLYLTGGLDKSGAGLEFGQNSSRTVADGSTAQVSEVKTGGKLDITAGNGMGAVQNQGSQIKSGGAVTIAAGDVDNQAAVNQQSTQQTSSHWGVDVGVNVDYSGITRPIVNAGSSVAKGDVAGAAGQAANLGAANLGVDISATGGSAQSQSQSSTAQATSIAGSSINVAASGALKDQATQYQATQGQVNISADSHQMTAAANTQSQSSQASEGGATVRVYTTTGEDVNVKGSGQGSYSSSQSASSNAVTGSIQSVSGVSVQVNNDASYQGVAINGGSGQAAIQAGGKLALTQADNTSSSQQRTVGGSAGLSISTSPIDGGNKLGGSGNLAVNSQQSQTASSQAVTGSVQSAGGIALSSGNGLTVQGGSLSSGGDVKLQSDGKISLQAATGSDSKTGSSWGFNVNAGGSNSNGKDASSKGFNVGGGVQLSSQNDSSATQAGAQLTSGGALSVNAGGTGNNAIALQGSQLAGKTVNLTADNGGISLQSAQNSSQKNDWSANANLGGGSDNKVAKENGQPKADGATKTYQANGGFNVKVDQQDKLINANATVKGEQVNVKADGQLTLAGGNIAGGKVDGSVGGNVVVQSQQDRNNSTHVELGLNVNSSNAKDPSLVDQAANLTGPLSGKVKDKATEAVNTVADKVEDKYNSFAFKNGLKEDTTQPVAFSKDANGGSVTLPEKPTSGEAKSGAVDSVLRKGGNTLKDKLLNPQDKGTQVSGVIDVSVKTDNSVGSVSAISGDQGVNLAVGGKAELTGGQIKSSAGKVSLGDAKVESSDIQTNSYTGAGGVKVDGTPAAIIQQAVKDVTSGKAPLIHAERDNQPQTVAGGIQSGS
ncbi:hemagglutinin repeat-containing protein [Chromobacterium sp. IIBBL 290-4]|uniref:hemagglutinin repeat-containing protein n=1 Tax=Chromobacterium sp. IIBBL 290-4 TaxID=2953890 RepID=UPI0020B67BBE|nr:hemagglutinin repeat-containing protein [Chromobacterium sp. IIBBL 290-4]UTH74165.1 hemagglutinin repeat-containing protein [Chromobacterium sp. IIBBL 290-4]